jgi:O-antigen/teichoic acid export membrane protein
MYVHGLNAPVGAYRVVWSGADEEAPGEALRERPPSAAPEVVIGTSVVFTVGWTIAAVVLLAPFAEQAADALTGSRDNGTALLLAVAAPGVFSIWRVLATIPRMELQTRRYAAFALARGLLGSTLGLVALALDESIAALLAGQLAGNGLVVALLAWRLRHHVRYRLDATALRTALAFGIAAIPNGLGNWGLFALDRYLLYFLTSPAEVGVFGAAFRFAMIVLVVDGAYRLAIGPLAYRRARRGEPVDHVRQSRQYTEQLLILLGVATLVSLAAPFLNALLGGGFADTGAIVPLFAFGLVVYGAYYRTLAGGGFGHKLVAHVVLLWGGVAAIAVLNVLLVPDYGAIGAGVAALLGYSAMLAAVMVIARRVRSVGLSFGPIVVAASACVGIVAAVEATDLGHAPGAGVRAGALVVAAAVLALALRHVHRAPAPK